MCAGRRNKMRCARRPYPRLPHRNGTGLLEEALQASFRCGNNRGGSRGLCVRKPRWPQEPEMVRGCNASVGSQATEMASGAIPSFPVSEWGGKGRRRSAIGAEVGPPSKRQPGSLRFRDPDLRAGLSECPPGCRRSRVSQSQTLSQARPVPSAPKSSSARNWRPINPFHLCSHRSPIRQGAARPGWAYCSECPRCCRASRYSRGRMATPFRTKGPKCVRSEKPQVRCRCAESARAALQRSSRRSWIHRVMRCPVPKTARVHTGPQYRRHVRPRRVEPWISKARLDRGSKVGRRREITLRNGWRLRPKIAR